MMLMLTPVAVGIPGYEELGETHALSMLLIVSWWIVEAYEQRTGKYGLLIHDVSGKPVMFLTTLEDLDHVSAMIELCIDLCSCWLVCAELIEQWRAIWWSAQAMIAQQRLREEVLG